MNDFEKQANDFCEAYGVKIYAAKLRHGYYFQDDKAPRDIYQIVIVREGHAPWSFEFGQSLAKSAAWVPSHILVSLTNPWTSEGRNSIAKALRCSVDRVSRRGTQISGVIPTAYEILARIEKTGPRSFADFCDDYGYNTDSIKAKALWERVLEEACAVQKMFGDCLEDLSCIF